MPLSLDILLVQPVNTGSYSGTTGSATLPSGTTAGSTVVLVATIATTASFNTPTGFVRDTPVSSTVPRLYVFRRGPVEGLAAGETSWALSSSLSGVGTWQVYEVAADVLDDYALDVVATFPGTATTSGTTLASNATPTSTTYDGLVLAAHAGYNATSATPPTFSGHSGGLVEQAESSGVSGSTSIGLSTSMLTTQQLGAYASTATSSMTFAAGSPGIATALVYTAKGARRASDPLDAWGFEWLTIAGNELGITSTRLFPTITGSPEVVNDSTKARTGNGYLRLSATAAAESVQGENRTLPAVTPKAVVQRRCFRFDGGLPSVDTELFSVVQTGGYVVRYITASSKLGLRMSTGAEVVSDATVPADTWIAVDVCQIVHTTAYTCDWQITYDATPGASSIPVAQTQATFTAGAAMSSYSSRLGWTTAITPGVPVLFDDCVDAAVAGAYPLGDHRIYLLNVDGSATPSVSGSTANFGVMTANGTVGAWNATSARNAVDDWPPTLGASADGAVAVTASATDYIEFPLETYNASGTASVRAARVLVPLWAASATTATCRVDGWDGTNSTALVTEQDPSADTSSTPPWVAAMWKPSGGWTQAKLDAAAIRFGSNDATPDIGPHAVGMEVAVQGGATQPQFGDAVAATRDPVTGGILKLTATPPGGYDATLHYEDPSGTDVATPGGATTTATLDAPDAPTVAYVAYYPPAEDISDA